MYRIPDDFSSGILANYRWALAGRQGCVTPRRARGNADLIIDMLICKLEKLTCNKCLTELPSGAPDSGPHPESVLKGARYGHEAPMDETGPPRSGDGGRGHRLTAARGRSRGGRAGQRQ